MPDAAEGKETDEVAVLHHGQRVLGLVQKVVADGTV
jgi:hypothetical protein